MGTYLRGKNPYPAVSDEFQRAFFVQFSSEVQIRSFMGDVSTAGAQVDVYVSNGQVTRGDSRFLCLANILANGVFNCPFTMKGTHLIFWPLPTEEPGDFVLREVRAWSRQDLGGSARVNIDSHFSVTESPSGSLQSLVGVSEALDEVITFDNGAWFYIDLGEAFDVKDIFIKTGETSSLANRYMSVSLGRTYDRASLFSACEYTALSKTNDEEWYLTTSSATSAQYILIGLANHHDGHCE
jgi:hypothetical protein